MLGEREQLLGIRQLHLQYMECQAVGKIWWGPDSPATIYPQLY